MRPYTWPSGLQMHNHGVCYSASEHAYPWLERSVDRVAGAFWCMTPKIGCTGIMTRQEEAMI